MIQILMRLRLLSIFRSGCKEKEGNVMRVFIIYLSLFLVFGTILSSEASSKVSAAAVVQVVQSSKSTYPGVSTTDAIAGLLKTLRSRGRFVDIVGWSQEYRSGGTQDVWFKVKIDDSLSEFHWVITPDGMINPANKLTQNVTIKQAAKP